MDPEAGLEIPPAIVRKLARGTHHSHNAVAVGNRAGVIEWANEAWTRVTGYALDASISKPVFAFLQEVDVDPSAVEFVARCFREGRTSELELEIHPPGRGALWIQLRVEPLCDASGEVSDFIATAVDISERQQFERAREVAEVDLSVLAAQVARERRGVLGARTDYDVELAENLPLVLADGSVLSGLVGRLICRAAEAIDDGWGTITLWTGILGQGKGPLFSRDLWRDLAGGHYAFLEVHDTGPASSGGDPSPVTEPFLSARYPRHAIRRETAELLVRSQGGELRIRSSHWAGTSVVILLPFA